MAGEEIDIVYYKIIGASPPRSINIFANRARNLRDYYVDILATHIDVGNEGDELLKETARGWNIANEFYLGARCVANRLRAAKSPDGFTKNHAGVALGFGRHIAHFLALSRVIVSDMDTQNPVVGEELDFDISTDFGNLANLVADENIPLVADDIIKVIGQELRIPLGTIPGRIRAAFEHRLGS